MKMKFSARVLPLLLLLSPSQAQSIFSNPISNYDRCLNTTEASSVATALADSLSVDLFPDKVTPDQSSYWQLEYHGTYKILKNTQENVDATYLLYQCGLDPSSYKTDEKVDGSFPVPFTGGLVVTETTQIPNIEILGRRSQISAFAVAESLISSPCLTGEIIPAGKEDGTITFLPGFNDTALEGYLSSRNGSDLAFGGGFDENPKMEGKIVISSVGESPIMAMELGRDVNEAIFEWLEVYGAIFNQEKEAGEIVEETSDRYRCHTENAARLAQERRGLHEGHDHSRPVVLWAYHMTDSNGTEIGCDVAECPNYYCTYAAHCQVDILNSTEGSVDYFGFKYMSDDEFVDFGKNADVWIYPSANWNTVETQKTEYLSQFKSVQNEKVYDYQKSGDSAWFEQRLVEYDTVLLDMCEVTERDIPTIPAHVRKWLRNVYTEGVGTLGTCADPNEPFLQRATECVKLETNSSAAEADESTSGSYVGSDFVIQVITLMSMILAALA